MNDKSQETDFLYEIGDCVTYNFTNDDDNIVEYAIIIGRNFVESHKTYKVIWLDNLIGYVAKEYEYLENQIKKVENNV